jgi:hypothetical protein
VTTALTPGDHLVTPRMGFTHHGIYLGDHRVMHYAGYIDGRVKKPVSIVTLTRFDNGFGYWVEAPLSRQFSPQHALERAYSRLGENSYNLLFNNCEHFVNWCISDQHASRQIKKFTFNAEAGYLKVKAIALALGKSLAGLRLGQASALPL